MPRAPFEAPRTLCECGWQPRTPFTYGDAQQNLEAAKICLGHLKRTGHAVKAPTGATWDAPDLSRLIERLQEAIKSTPTPVVGGRERVHKPRPAGRGRAKRRNCLTPEKATLYEQETYFVQFVECTKQCGNQIRVPYYDGQIACVLSGQNLTCEDCR